VEVASHDEVDYGGALPDLRRTVATEALWALRLVGSWLRRSARFGKCFGEDGEDCGGKATMNFAGGVKLGDGGGKIKKRRRRRNVLK
jgi:hypothetical protein